MGTDGRNAEMVRNRKLGKQRESPKGGQLNSNKNAMVIQCTVCKTKFICTISEVECKEHAGANHPGSELYACFPHLKK